MSITRKIKNFLKVKKVVAPKETRTPAGSHAKRARPTECPYCGTNDKPYCHNQTQASRCENYIAS